MPTLTARSLKYTCVLDARELLDIFAPETGPSRLTLHIKLPDRMLHADLAAKSIRRAKATIQELGVDNVAVVLQGRLGAGDALLDAGLAAQPKVKKPEPEPSAAYKELHQRVFGRPPAAS